MCLCVAGGVSAFEWNVLGEKLYCVNGQCFVVKKNMKLLNGQKKMVAQKKSAKVFDLYNTGQPYDALPVPVQYLIAGISYV